MPTALSVIVEEKVTDFVFSVTLAGLSVNAEISGATVSCSIDNVSIFALFARFVSCGSTAIIEMLCPP